MDKKESISRVPQETFQDSVDRDDSVITRNKMESKLKNRKSSSKHRYDDIKAYFKDLYQ